MTSRDSGRALVGLLVGAVTLAAALGVANATDPPGSDCTHPIVYWQANTNPWPAAELMLGNVNYSRADLVRILVAPAGGNGLISLAQQLITAQLNIHQGADPTDVAEILEAADLKILGLVVPPVGGGYLNPSVTGAITQALEEFNLGITGPGACGVPRNGACCLSTDQCDVMTKAECDGIGGSYYGDDTTCSPGMCQPSATEHSTWGRIKHLLYR